MVDNLSKQTRSRVMTSIKSKNTKPEMVIRKILWLQGFRYRIHDRSIIGTPDISSKKAKLAIFIDGCFWHGCKRCYKEPKSNVGFWRKKIQNNRKKRNSVRTQLRREGWNVLEFWEREINANSKRIATRVFSCLEENPNVNY